MSTPNAPWTDLDASAFETDAIKLMEWFQANNMSQMEAIMTMKYLICQIIGYHSTDVDDAEIGLTCLMTDMIKDVNTLFKQPKPPPSTKGYH